MKKSEKKHDLVKVAGIMVLITVLLTWIVPQGMFQGSGINVTEITRVGIFDFFTYGLLGMYYFTVLVTFLFVLGAFYQVLSRTNGYQNLTSSIAKKFNGKEILFTLVVSFLIAAISAVTNEYIVVLSIIPFIITIMNKMKLDKITGFVTTFGAILVGVLGSVYSTKVVGMSINYFSQYYELTYSTLLWVRLVMFAVSYIAFSVFTVLHIRKTRKNNNNEVMPDLFASTETNEKSRSGAISIAIVFGIFAIITLLAYLPWSEAFNTSWTTKALEAITGAEVFGSPIFAYILGNVSAFGQWDIFGVQIVMLVAILVIKLVDKMSMNEVIESFGEGFKKVGKLVIILLICYVVLEFAVMFPVLPTIVDWFLGLFSNASEKLVLVISPIAGLFTSLFTVEYQYTASLIGLYLGNAHPDFYSQIAFMLQSTFGLASMFSPASAILLMGLSYLGISYKEWMKYIWKYLIIMFAVIIILMIIIC